MGLVICLGVLVSRCHPVSPMSSQTISLVPSPTPSISSTPYPTPALFVQPLATLNLSPSMYGRRHQFSWSPGGEAIVFFPEENSACGTYNTLWVAQSPSYIPQPLPHQPGREPLWSPKGNRIAFVAIRQPECYPETIWVMRADGSEVGDLLPGERAIRTVSSLKFLGPWLDNRTLVFMDACGTGCRTLVPIDVVTGEIQELCGHGEEAPLFLGMDYHWSPSLNRFVVTEGGGIPRIRLVQLNDHNDCREQDLPTPAEFHAWSPNGNAFLFSHWQWELGQGDPSPVIAQVPRLYIWDVPQGKVRWTGPAGGYEGAWSPDGKRLAFFLLGNPRYEGQSLIGSDLVPGSPFPLFLVILDVQTEEVLTFVPLGENISSKVRPLSCS